MRMRLGCLSALIDNAALSDIVSPKDAAYTSLHKETVYERE